MAIATPNNTVSKNNQALFERGFKAWCENTSLSMRIKLGIESHEPLDALILAERLGVHILPLDQVDHLPPETIDHLSSPTDSEWSAVTVSLGKTCVVVTNPSHTPGRTSSDLMHELAHIVLNHIPGESFFTHDLMMREYDTKQEAEADWLAGTLLLPRKALEHIKYQRIPTPSVLEHYKVSAQLYEYRCRMTAVNRQFGR